MTNLNKLEYRVKEKTVFFVTRYCKVGDSVSLSTEGEFANSLTAHRAAKALAKLEATTWGIDIDDERLIFPSVDYTKPTNLSDG